MGSGATLERLLLIEDDDTTREVLTLLLEADGWQVAAAAHGEAGLAAAAAGEQPQVVLCDLHLPGIHGEQLAARLREAYPQATVLGMSASTSASVPEGYAALLLKPFSAEQVRSQLATLQTAAADPHSTQVEARAPVLDAQTVATLERQMGARAADLYAFALADADSRIARMREAQRGGDTKTFCSEAHALKGSAGMIGARRLAEHAAAAETMRSIEKSAANSMVEALEVACAEIRLMLETLLPVQAAGSRAR